MSVSTFAVMILLSGVPNRFMRCAANVALLNILICSYDFVLDLLFVELVFFSHCTG